MARTLDQIIAEIGSPYQSQIKNLQSRASDLPNQIKAERSGLEATQEQAFGNILSGARQRGLGFSGIPLGEQAKYTATEFLPAVARLQQSGREQAMSLQDAIANVQTQRNTYAQQLRQAELDREQQERQFQQSLRAQRAAQAAQAADLSSYFGGGGGSAAGGGGSGATIQRTKNGGFNFFDQGGAPVTALQYARTTGTNFRDLLKNMAKDGDKNAQIALKYVNNFGEFSNVDSSYRGALGALGAQGSFSSPTRGGALRTGF